MSDLVLGPPIGKLGGGDLIEASPEDGTNEVVLDLPDGEWCIVARATGGTFQKDYITINGSAASAHLSEADIESHGQTAMKRHLSGTVTVSTNNARRVLQYVLAFPDPIS
ncbi:hypothetical protein [Corynebacterium glyciniphilum]|uniref:hypothetical protein n=1 Tax=Corynebacterium glyciniphilum TaxID=1404244 RepID=UPI0026554DF8|nr:hypothetical protein [Corynebacterium glyciniphilum]MDN6707068.1 hypothetical protein [Corynebacterium glyciniphilum]